MLYIIGTGLGSFKDISLRSFKILHEADLIYQECYTCMQSSDFETNDGNNSSIASGSADSFGNFIDFIKSATSLESLIGKPIIMADRRTVEETMEIVEESRSKNVVFLVAGTPFFATTYTDLLIRAKEAGVPTHIIHNTSIMNAKGCFGLYSYNFGKTVSIPYFTETCKYISCYDNIYNNYKNGLHTLCLLDIKTDEQRFMTANEAIEQLLYCEGERGNNMILADTEIFVVCRFATETELVKFGRASELVKMEFGLPLHSLIVPGKLDEIEREFIEKWFM